MTAVDARIDHLAIATRYAAAPDRWPVAPRFNPADRWYHRIADEPDYEVWLLTWLPGQGTDLHDHGGSAGAFVVVSGSLREEVVDLGRVRARETVLPAGAARSFGAHHIHRITNTGPAPAVSLHVYAPALREMTRYRIEDGTLSKAVVEKAGVDW